MICPGCEKPLGKLLIGFNVRRYAIYTLAEQAIDDWPHRGLLHVRNDGEGDTDDDVSISCEECGHDFTEQLRREWDHEGAAVPLPLKEADVRGG